MWMDLRLPKSVDIVNILNFKVSLTIGDLRRVHLQLRTAQLKFVLIRDTNNSQ